MPLNAHTAKFVVAKKISEEDKTIGTSTMGIENRRAHIASSAGSASEA